MLASHRTLFRSFRQAAAAANNQMIQKRYALVKQEYSTKKKNTCFNRIFQRKKVKQEQEIRLFEFFFFFFLLIPLSI